MFCVEHCRGRSGLLSTSIVSDGADRETDGVYAQAAPSCYQAFSVGVPALLWARLTTKVFAIYSSRLVEVKGQKALAQAFQSKVGMFLICGRIRYGQQQRHCALYSAAMRLLIDRPNHAVKIPQKGEDAASQIMFDAGYVKKGYTVHALKINKKFVAETDALLAPCAVTGQCFWKGEVGSLLVWQWLIGFEKYVM